MPDLTILPTALSGAYANGVNMTPTSLSLIEDMSIAELVEVEPQFRYAEQGLPWWRGDFYNYIEDKYPDEYAQMMGIDLTANQTIHNCQSVCRQYAPHQRLLTLSFSHHAALAYKSTEIRDRMMALCLESDPQWTCAKLRQVLKDLDKAAEEIAATPDNAPTGNGDYLPLDLPISYKQIYSIAEEHLTDTDVRTLYEALGMLLNASEQEHASAAHE